MPESTKGPWSAIRLRRAQQGRPAIRGNDLILVTHTFDGKEAEANINLMAAAPDMYDALISARGALRLDAMVKEDGEHFGTTKVALELIDMALQKAEGIKGE